MADHFDFQYIPPLEMAEKRLADQSSVTDFSAKSSFHCIIWIRISADLVFRNVVQPCPPPYLPLTKSSKFTQSTKCVYSLILNTSHGIVSTACLLIQCDLYSGRRDFFGNRLETNEKSKPRTKVWLNYGIISLKVSHATYPSLLNRSHQMMYRTPFGISEKILFEVSLGQSFLEDEAWKFQ